MKLAEEVIRLAERGRQLPLIYEDEMPLKEKIEAVAREVYGADGSTLLRLP